MYIDIGIDRCIKINILPFSFFTHATQSSENSLNHNTHAHSVNIIL